MNNLEECFIIDLQLINDFFDFAISEQKEKITKLIDVHKIIYCLKFHNIIHLALRTQMIRFVRKILIDMNYNKDSNYIYINSIINNEDNLSILKINPLVHNYKYPTKLFSYTKDFWNVSINSEVYQNIVKINDKIDIDNFVIKNEIEENEENEKKEKEDNKNLIDNKDKDNDINTNLIEKDKKEKNISDSSDEKEEEEEEEEKKIEIDINDPKFEQFKNLKKTKLFKKYLKTKYLLKMILNELSYYFSTHFNYLCYIIIIINHMTSGSLLTIVYPFLIFCYSILEYPRPTRYFWNLCLNISLIILIIKFVIQLDLLDEIPGYENFITNLYNYKFGLKYYDSTFSFGFLKYILGDSLTIIV
jgi:hypothetical protein